MKKIVETDGEGLEALLGEEVSIWCMNYIYCGKLIGMNEISVILEDAQIVYETGAFDEAGWKDAQRLPWKEHFIMLTAIESIGRIK